MRLFLGIDIGSTEGKAVALSEDGQVVGTSSAPALGSAAEVAERLREAAARCVPGKTTLSEVVATGRGRFRVRCAHRNVNEVLCQALGVVRLVPSARTVLDIGGRDARLILLGPQGDIEDFLVQADCVVGMRRLLELVAAALEKDVRDLAGLRGGNAHRLEIDGSSSVCADRQVVSLLAGGEPHQDIWAGIQRALAARLSALVEGLPVDVKAAPLFLTGGMSHHAGLVDELRKRCGLEVEVAPDPAFTAALGAAMVAWTGAARDRRPAASRRGEDVRRTAASQAPSGATVHCVRRLH